jgi:RNA polymerase sigma-70 factor (ECF subfamily)
VIDLDVHLQAITVGDTAAFARWVAGAEPAVRASLVSFAAQVDVEVVVQEALLRAWQLAPRVERDGRGNSLLRFTFKTARNLAIDDLRQHRRELPLDAEAELPVTAIEPDPLLRRAIEACRKQLPAKPARALEARLSAQGADSDESIARELGMKTNTLLKNFGRARQFLLECLGRRGIRLSAEMAP